MLAVDEGVRPPDSERSWAVDETDRSGGGSELAAETAIRRSWGVPA
ncbi:hypothetical protein ACFQJD_02980 [Haloplanus sp. GCM10025708]